MRGVVFTGDRKLEIMEFPDPEPGPREVVYLQSSSASGISRKSVISMGTPPAWHSVAPIRWVFNPSVPCRR